MQNFSLISIVFIHLSFILVSLFYQMQPLLDNLIFLPNFHPDEFCFLHILEITATNECHRNPFEESDETCDHVEYKATAYQRSKTSDIRPNHLSSCFLKLSQFHYYGGTVCSYG